MIEYLYQYKDNFIDDPGAYNDFKIKISKPLEEKELNNLLESINNLRYEKLEINSKLNIEEAITEIIEEFRDETYYKL